MGWDEMVFRRRSHLTGQFIATTWCVDYPKQVMMNFVERQNMFVGGCRIGSRTLVCYSAESPSCRTRSCRTNSPPRKISFVRWVVCRASPDEEYRARRRCLAKSETIFPATRRRASLEWSRYVRISGGEEEATHLF